MVGELIMPAFIDMTGQRIGHLTVIRRNGMKGHNTGWLCQCDCGREITVAGQYLRSGQTMCADCKNKNERFWKHGMSKTRLFNIWSHMKNRCNQPKCDSYKHYGGRGIKVCNDWCNDFNSFKEWALSNGYSDNLTLDRIDVNGNYEPSNCRWVPQKQQARNQRRTIYVETPDGIMTISEAAEKYNLEYACILYRYHQGMKGETLVSESSRPKAR